VGVDRKEQGPLPTHIWSKGRGCCDEEELRTPPILHLGQGGGGGDVVWLSIEKYKDPHQLTFRARAGAVMMKKN
jgi:hypothetical protein